MNVAKEAIERVKGEPLQNILHITLKILMEWIFLIGK